MANVPIIYDGILLGPIGNVATILSAMDVATHRQRAIDLFQFLVDVDSVLLQLNMDHKPQTCIVGMPDSNHIWVLHSVGIGASGI